MVIYTEERGLGLQSNWTALLSTERFRASQPVATSPATEVAIIAMARRKENGFQCSTALPALEIPLFLLLHTCVLTAYASHVHHEANKVATSSLLLCNTVVLNSYLLLSSMTASYTVSYASTTFFSACRCISLDRRREESNARRGEERTSMWERKESKERMEAVNARDEAFVVCDSGS